MRINRLREGLEVANKLDGKWYKVTNADTIDGVGSAKEMIIEDGRWTGEFGDGKVLITEKNALAFRIINDPKPYPIPEGYFIEAGKLMKDGKEIETGELRFVRFLAVQPDFLILAAEKKGTKEGMVELMSYQMSRDRFLRMHTVPETVKLLKYVGEGNERAVLGYSAVTEKEVTDEGGNKKTVRVFDQAGLLTVIEGKRLHCCRLESPFVVEDAFVKEVPSINGHFEAFLPVDEEEDEDGYLVSRKTRMWMRTDGGNVVSDLEADGKIRADWSFAYNGFVIRTNDMIVIPTEDIKITSAKVAELDGYDTLIDITKENYEYRLTFSNGKYEFKILVSKSTRDRGYIVTVD